MAGIKKVLNWFVTIETDEAQPAPPKAASKDPDEAALAARQQAERGSVGKQPEQPRRVGQVKAAGAAKTLEEELAELDAELAGGPPAAPQHSAPQRSSADSFDAGSMGEDSGLVPQTFEELYAAQDLPGPDAPDFSIYKVESLLSSEHIKSLDNNIKRASLLVAMQASNVTVDTVIADACNRDKALDTHDDELQFTLQLMEDRVAQQNKDIQAEVEELLRRMQAQIGQNNTELEAARATYATWKQAKKVEEQRLYNAIALFIAPGQKNHVTLDD